MKAKADGSQMAMAIEVAMWMSYAIYFHSFAEVFLFPYIVVYV